MKTPASLTTFLLSLLLALSCISSVVRSEEEVEVNVCPKCDCTKDTLKNLQQSLDNCKRMKEMNERVMKLYENNNKMMTAAMKKGDETLGENDGQLKADRDRLLDVVKDLQMKLKLAQKKQVEIDDEKEDLLDRVQTLEAELKAVKILNTNKTATATEEL